MGGGVLEVLVVAHSGQRVEHLEEDDSKIAKVIIAFAFFIVIITFPVSAWFCFKVVNEYERAVIFRLGRLKHGGARGPGLFFVLPYVDTFRRIGLRAGCYDIDEQLIMTKDSVTVKVDAIVLFQVFNPLAAVCNNKNFKHSTLTLARTNSTPNFQFKLADFGLAKLLTADAKGEHYA